MEPKIYVKLNPGAYGIMKLLSMLFFVTAIITLILGLKDGFTSTKTFLFIFTFVGFILIHFVIIRPLKKWVQYMKQKYGR